MLEKQNSTNNPQKEVNLQLHKEELQITKEQIQTADVKVYKKTYTEVKEIRIPVTREELIIEKTLVTSQEGDARDNQNEIITIPLSEERIEVTLNPIQLNDIEVYKKQFEENILVNENVKEEILHIDTVGDVKVIVDESTV